MTNLLIKCVSDIHLEFLPEVYVLPKPKNESNLPTCAILAGDIGHPMTEKYAECLKRTRQNFDYVLVVSGNHEYYKQAGNYWTMQQIDDKIKQLCEQYKCHYLNMSGVTLHGTRFIGATFWGHIPNEHSHYVESRIADFRNILLDEHTMDHTDYNDLHNQHRQYIKHELELAKQNNQKVVVITHHAPSWSVIQPKYQTDITSYAYASHSEDLLIEPAILWINGHLHDTHNITINGVRCVSNCRGYVYVKNGQTKYENEHYKEHLEIIL